MDNQPQNRDTTEAEVDAIFAKALSLERSGDWHAAIALYDRLAGRLEGQPNGAYAHNCADRLRGMSARVEEEIERATYRDGELLVVGNGASLPDRCIKCNATHALSPSRVKFHWASPAARVVFFLCVLGSFIFEEFYFGNVVRQLGIKLPIRLFLIVGIIGWYASTRRATIRLSFCSVHRSQRKLLRMRGALIGSAVVGLLFLIGVWSITSKLPSPNLDVFLGIAIFGMIGAWLGWAESPDVVGTERIDSRFIWVKGASEDYLAMFPTRDAPR